MANFNPTTGKWEAQGGGEYDSRHGAQQREYVNNSGGSGSSAGFQNAMIAALWKFFCLIPTLLGLAVGGILGAILKLGMVGKVILTAVAAIGAFFIIIIFSETVCLPTHNIFMEILIVILTVLVGAWFWIWHYKAIRQMPYSHFVAYTQRCMSICFWGPILLGIVFGILQLTHTIEKNPIGFGGCICIPLIVAIAYWIWTANSYRLPETPEMPEAGYAADEQPVYLNNRPAPLPSEAKRCTAGDLIWARWSRDGNLYFAGIAAGSATGVRVVYYDGTEEEVNRNDIFYLNEAQKSGLTPHGNWKDKGAFYPCEILELREDSVLVKYTEDNTKEELPYHGLVFMN